ncbi:hypothetical protein [Streptomyces sp. NPDC056361]|uniref:hypothetical protein n=1 Tax=Streptomyces sp. NPDC056361 TaxID=3345795 RepID=UPI0035DB4051
MLPRARYADGTLHLTLPDLDIPARAAAAVEVQALVLAYRPECLRVELHPGRPSPATLSVLARTRRLCGALGIPLVLVEPLPTAAPPTITAA